jgi:hypothetical protein
MKHQAMKYPVSKHPPEVEIALLAGGDCSRISRFFLERHTRACRECYRKLEEFRLLRLKVSTGSVRDTVPDIDWGSLAAEMKANIRLGLEAGECVRTPDRARVWNPRLTVAFASLSFLICAGVLMRNPATISHPVTEQSAPVLESTRAGLELREGASSITLINRPGATTDQTVSAEGEIRARNVEGGAVTITNVSF